MNTDTVFSVPLPVLQFERTIRNLTDAEITGIFSMEGIHILTLHAVDTGVGFFTVIPVEMKEQIQGCILTHNHPSGRSFTKRDLEEASFFALAEIRVVGRFGIYSMKPGGVGWPAPRVIAEAFTSIEDDPDFQAEIDNFRFRTNQFRYAKGSVSGIERILSDILCERVATALNLTYRRSIRRDTGNTVLQA
ncbi:MPN domain-containing protein [Methanogenium organophilum]|uniref:JAB domain-containing protein n=1 Tax=Methanogenium organophilum TaxID=2199 RepID=A0A9X9S4R8_METOG|nr:hypothetical protein [Methanogenium organophilum]WAI01712.1 hypothetical protein OU421_02235 [Methanogenium organophilum]